MQIQVNDIKESNNRPSAAGIVNQAEIILSNKFEDNRPEAVAQRKIQDLANNSKQVKQAAELQAMANRYAATQKKTYIGNSKISDKAEFERTNKDSYVIQKVKYPSTTSGKTMKPGFDDELDRLKFISKQNYTPHTDIKAGGIHSSVKLGPSRTIVNEGTKANSNLPTHINSARKNTLITSL